MGISREELVNKLINECVEISLTKLKENLRQTITEVIAGIDFKDLLDCEYVIMSNSSDLTNTVLPCGCSVTVDLDHVSNAEIDSSRIDAGINFCTLHDNASEVADALFDVTSKLLMSDIDARWKYPNLFKLTGL